MAYLLPSEYALVSKLPHPFHIPEYLVRAARIHNQKCTPKWRYISQRDNHYAPSCEANHEASNNTRNTQPPIVYSPRPHTLHVSNDAEHLIDMTDMDCELKCLMDIKYCTVEPVSPRPIVLPAIPDAELLMDVVQEEDSILSSVVPSEVRPNYVPLLEIPSPDASPSSWQSMDEDTEMRSYASVDPPSFDYVCSSTPPPPYYFVSSPPLPESRSELPWNVDHTYATDARTSRFRPFSLPDFAVSQATRYAEPNHCIPMDVDDDEEDYGLQFFLPAYLKEALDMDV